MLPRIVFTCMVAVVGVTSIAAQTSGPVNVSSTVDVKEQSQTLVTMVRGLVTGAKEGTPLARLRQNVLDLQNYTSGLLVQLPGKVSECHTQAVIKMAAAAIGSHEVLNAMLANGEMEILSRRIGLALSFDDQVAQLLEDKVSRSSDVGPELYAMIFGLNTTANIIKTADAAIREKLTLVKDVNRSRRDVARQLARGFDVINHVGWWRDTTGWHTFHVGPFRPPIPSHRPSHVQRRSPQWNGGITGSGGTGSGNLNGNLGWSNPNGGLSGGVGGGVSWGPGGVQRNVNGNLGWTSSNRRVSAGVNGGVTWGQGGPTPNVGATLRIKF